MKTDTQANSDAANEHGKDNGHAAGNQSGNNIEIEYEIADDGYIKIDTRLRSIKQTTKLNAITNSKTRAMPNTTNNSAQSGGRTRT